ncbi:MAG TPA: 16S rRNA (adenine(1518)-N(6)/adenine(1519)-N(6))-dimethyltransferase RsmA [Streptosporangiaceae bacterium]|nr:16S rRNA (adenine(1518)-N(6)/adenine(1519)-N(6))-dimethyltransferase RsmA [Streptosporangiaceae bacterium]
MNVPGARLLGPAEIRHLASRFGIRPSKRLGQNFVIDQGTIRRIVALADLRQDDVVLEVGPGIGSLTLGLIEAAGLVVAVEVDPLLARELPGIVADRAPGLAGRLEVITADALSLTGAAAAHAPTALVANLPYNVAVPVVLHLLEEMPSIGRALVMVQAEVADRMAAQPGSKIYGVPSVKLAWYGSVRRAGTVSRTVFWPAPNVDSALVAFTRWPEATGPEASSRPGGPDEMACRSGVSREEVFAVVDAAFAQRRKTLRSALAAWAGSPRAAESVLREAGVDPSLRGEAIGIQQYIRIVLAGREARTIIES